MAGVAEHEREDAVSPARVVGRVQGLQGWVGGVPLELREGSIAHVNERFRAECSEPQLRQPRVTRRTVGGDLGGDLVCGNSSLP